MKAKLVSGTIISPLGFSIDDNYKAVLENRSCLKTYNGKCGLPFPFVSSLIDDDILSEKFYEDIDSQYLTINNPTKFEMMAILAAVKAVEESGIDPASERTIFILSSTKGNVHLLLDDVYDEQRLLLGTSARLIADYFRSPNCPIVVSNACISGLCAQIEAWRCIASGQYDSCVVVGADAISPFIVAGFNCLKALSDEPCRPFSCNRKGLNLGEAAAAMVFVATDDDDASSGWKLLSGAVRNDANHISAPSRTGDGSFMALQYALSHSAVTSNDIACLSVHGTATMFNDEMESVAICRAGLDSVPVNALKGFYGHTLGAAGVLETLLNMRSLDDGIVLPTRGFDELGVSNKINVSDKMQHTDKRTFVKLLSGFGGCNAAAVFSK